MVKKSRKTTTGNRTNGVEKRVRNIRRNRRKRYSSEDKIRIVRKGLRGEGTVAELCRREGISESLYYKWSKDFLEAGKARLVGNTKRQASTDEVKELQSENEQLKQLVAEIALRNRMLKKSVLGSASEWEV